MGGIKTDKKKKVLVVDDGEVNRALLEKVLRDTYTVLQAADGEQALELLWRENGTIAAVLLDLFMPVLDGYEFLARVRENKEFADLPILVMTQSEEDDTELRALELGATDFLNKPYKPAILLQRLYNILAMHESIALRNTLERDELTGVYNRSTFNRKAQALLEDHPEEMFEVLGINVERFKLVNEIFGNKEGDRLLCYLAQLLTACSVGDPLKVCARLGSDKFALFVPQQEGFAEQLITQMNRQLKLYPLDLRVTVRCGICRTSDVPANVQQMCDRAQLAGEAVRGRFDCAYAYYDGEQRRRVLEAQELIEEMHRALEQQQFEVVFQPKYNLTTGEIAGAEALVRWNHPTKGMISPENFIPLFEKNGFISMLDYYVWDIVCKQLAQWIRETKHPVPLSVNISRVDIYNPNLVEILHTLVEKYELHPAWLELEITESAYTENPEQMIEVVHALKQEGFLIEMDDFGTGYSSLNMLSEVSVDVIKMDMRFLQGAAVPGKGKNILHFVVGLSKWMGLAVIAEGIETREQVAFLRSMGCNRGQGYYFSKPLCAQEFEALLNGEATKEICSENVFSATIDINEIWNPFSQFNLLFNSYVGALGIFEYSAERMFLLRANENCYRLFSNDRESLSRATTNIMELMYEDDRLYFGNAMKNMIETNGEEICDLRFHSLLHKRKSRTLHLHIRVIYNSPERVLFLSSMEDFTEMKRLEEKLVRQREFFVRIYDTVSCGILRFSITKGLIVRSSNLAGMKLLGCERSDVENGTVDYFEMIRKEDRAMVERAVRELASEPIDSIIVIEYRIKNLRGETLWVNDNTRSMEDENGNRIYQTVLNDITLRKQREQELRLIQEQYLIATRHAHNKIFRYDPHTKQTVVFAQEVNEQMMPVLIEDLPGKMIESGRVATESVADYKNFFNQIEAGVLTGRAELRMCYNNDKMCWYDARFYNQFDADGKPLQAICAFSDINEMKEKELDLYEVARRDPLTGLYNRKAFEDMINAALAAQTNDQSKGAFLMLDLDNFKAINDRLGHLAGDTVLKDIALLISCTLRKNDIVARLGGDEFAIYLLNVSSGELAQKRAQAIREAVAQYRENNPAYETLSCSVGIACAPQQGTTFAELYRAADHALYHAKNSGKNRCELYEKDKA